MSKKCPKCEETKDNSEFYKDKSRMDGLTTYCKECENDYHQKWVENNRDHLKEWRANWIEENREQYRKRWREYHKANKEKRNKQHRKCNRKRRKKPENRINLNMGNMLRAALQEKKSGRHWEDLVNYSLEDLMEHLEKQFADWMTWDNWGRADEDQKTWQIDHIKPKSAFDYDSVDDPEFKECWALDNLQPLESSKNLSKGGA